MSERSINDLVEQFTTAREQESKNHQTTISVETARDVLGYFGCKGGWNAGSFTTNLMTAIGSADPENRAKLALGFPELVTALIMAQNTTDGISKLQKLIEDVQVGHETPSRSVEDAL